MHNSIRSGRPATAILTAHYTGLLKSIIKRRKAGEIMTEKQIAIDAAIFAIANMQNKGSTAYGYKDKEGKWHAMEWDHVITLLYKLRLERQVKNI